MLFLVLSHVGFLNMAAFFMRIRRRILLQRGLSPLLRVSPALVRHTLNNTSNNVEVNIAKRILKEKIRKGNSRSVMDIKTYFLKKLK